MRKIKYYLIIFLLSYSTLHAVNISPALKILLQIEKKFLELKTIKGTFIKTVTKDGETVKIHCKFFYKKPDKIRFDYLEPIVRNLKSDGKTLYFSENKKQIVKSISSLSIQEKANYGLITGFGLDYLAPIKVELYEFKIKEEKGENLIISAVSQKSNLPSMEFYVNKQKKFITNIKYFDNKNSLLAEIKFFDFKEISKDNWFAMKTAFNNSLIKEETEYNNMRFNIELDDKLFLEK